MTNEEVDKLFRYCNDENIDTDGISFVIDIHDGVHFSTDDDYKKVLNYCNENHINLYDVCRRKFFV